VELIDFSPELTKSEALKLEYRIKKMSADQKIAGLNQAQREILIRYSLLTLRQDIKALVKLIDKLLKEI